MKLFLFSTSNTRLQSIKYTVYTYKLDTSIIVNQLNIKMEYTYIYITITFNNY